MAHDETNESRRGGRPPTPGADVVTVTVSLPVARIKRFKLTVLEGLESGNLSIREAAPALGLSSTTVQRMLNADELPLDFVLAILAIAGLDIGDVVSTDGGLVLARDLGAVLSAVCAWHVVDPEAAMVKDDDGEE